jgi:hypothetical protein
MTDRFLKNIGGPALAMSLLCQPQLTQAQPTQAQPPAAAGLTQSHILDGLWVAEGGGYLFDPDTQNRPENKGLPYQEMRIFPPYNAEYEAKYSKNIADLRAGRAVYDPNWDCLPFGMPRILAVRVTTQISTSKNHILWYFETGLQHRIIYTDGRKHTNPEDIDPTFVGESIGHWEGDTLVVTTIGISEKVVFDATVSMHSDALKITERIRRIGDRLEDKMVLEDPKAFTKPWQITRHWRLSPDAELVQNYCDNPRRISDVRAPPAEK